MLFEDSATLIRKNTAPSSLTSSVPYIGLEHIAQEKLQLNGIGESTDVTSTKQCFQSGDILFGKLRPYFRKVVRPNFDGICSTDIWVIRPKGDVDSRFLFYWCSSWGFVNFVDAASEGTRMPRAKWDVAQIHRIPNFTISEQKSIAHILGILDDKIELNQKINKTLEEIAKSIFKSWFVDFDPVRAKAERRPTNFSPEISELFPDELVDSEIGEIPKGWEITTLNSHLSFVLGGDWGKSEFSEKTPNQCYCIRGADIANLQSFKTSDMPVRFLKESSFTKRQLRPWDVVFEISGGSPTQSTGRTVFVTPEIIQNYDFPLTASNFCRLLRFQSKEQSLFHYMAFRNAYDRNDFFQHETGTTGIKNFGFKYFSEENQYIIPPQKCLTTFEELVYPKFERLGVSMRENVTLSSLRDTLLPKLISGKLRIPDAEKFLEEVGS